MCGFLRWQIEPVPDLGPSLPLGIATIRPALRHELMPPEVGILLPCADTNVVVLSALDAAPERFAGLGIGLFLSDPFLNVDLAMRRLAAAGVAWIAALPSACQHENDFRQYLREVDLDLERERRVLAALSGAGFATIATVSSAADAAAAGGLPTAVLVLPGVSAFVKGFPELAVRLDLERAVAARAPEHGRPLRLGLRRPEETAEAGGLDGLVLRPKAL